MRSSFPLEGEGGRASTESLRCARCAAESYVRQGECEKRDEERARMKKRRRRGEGTRRVEKGR